MMTLSDVVEISEQYASVDIEGIEEDSGAGSSTGGNRQSLQHVRTIDSYGTSTTSNPSPLLGRKRKQLKVQFTVDQSDFELNEGLSSVESITRKASVIVDPNEERVYRFLRRLSKRPTVSKYCCTVVIKKDFISLFSFLVT